MKTKAYPKYKPSGVEWLGDVPVHWEVKQTRHIFKIYSGSTPKSGEDLFWDGDIVWFTPEDLGNNQQKNISESRRKITKEGYKSCGTSLAKSNSVVLSTRAPIGHIALSTVSACCNQGCRILEPENGNTDYWYYTMVSAKPIVQSLGQGSTFMELPRQSFASFNLPFPSSEEQQAIAAFLDRETKHIEALIAKKKKLLSLLAEQRTALISRAVTKGLNPSVKLKPSGVEWLGDVPEHWGIWKLAHLTVRIGSGKTPTGGAEVYQNEGVIFLRSQNVYDDGLYLDDVVYIDQKIDDEMAWSRVQGKDILLNITGASLGRTCIVKNEFPKSNVNQHVCVIRLTNTDYAEYISLYLKSKPAKAFYDFVQTGSAREGLNFQQIGAFPITLPPLSEQQAIAAFLDRETAKIGTLSAKVLMAIERLREYRTALISAAVTGKIDVREAV